MTLGSSPTPAQILAELGESFPYTFPDAKTRWLADVGASAPITFPTSFANKTSVKIVASVVQSGTASSPHTFSGVNFGLAFSGRVLIACLSMYRPVAATLDITSVTIGGVVASGYDNGEFLASGPTMSAGIFAASVPSGTSGNVVVNHSGSLTTSGRIGLVLISVASISATAFHSSQQSFSGSGGTSASGTINIPSNGVLVVAASRGGNTNNITMSGVTERTEITVGSGRFAVGFDNRLGSQTGRAISASWSGTSARGFTARSYAQ